MHKYTVNDNLPLTSTVNKLSLRPAEGSKPMMFEAGQYISIGFKANGRPTPVRCFSIVNSTSQDGLVEIAYRVKGHFTKALSRISVGQPVYIQGPFGEFVPDLDYAPMVFMAGGIGITPFMSILRSAVAKNQKIPITLLYSVRSSQDIPFLSELMELSATNSWLTVIFSVSEDPTAMPAGLHVMSGSFSAEFLTHMTSGKPTRYMYYICGPSGFMKYQIKQLAAIGVDGERIMTESFTQTGGSWLSRFSQYRRTYAMTGLAFILGFLVIMGIDLKRALPVLSAASSQSQPNSGSSTSESGAATAGSNQTNAAASDSTSSNQSSNSSTPVTTPQSQTYQAPVTSVS